MISNVPMLPKSHAGAGREDPVYPERTVRPEPPNRDMWAVLREVPMDARLLTRRRIVAANRTDSAAAAFDVLRTRLLRTLRERGWHRVAITSPTQACGKSFVAANLAVALARVPRTRTLLVELDLRLPTLARLLGVPDPGRLRALLDGTAAIADHVVRAGPGLALALNAAAETDAAELLQDPATGTYLAELDAALRVDVTLYDLPPVLACDDVLGFLPNVDGVLLVAGGGTTRAEEMRRCERLFGDQAPIIGVILNKSEDAMIEPYGYARR